MRSAESFPTSIRGSGLPPRVAEHAAAIRFREQILGTGGTGSCVQTGTVPLIRLGRDAAHRNDASENVNVSQPRVHSRVRSMSAPRVRFEPMFELTARTLSELRDSVDRRRHDRFALQRPAVVFPVARDGKIDPGKPIYGASREISESGILLQLSSGDFEVSQELLVGLNLEGEQVQYAGVIVRRVVQSSGSPVLIGAEFGGAADAVRAEQLLSLRFDSQSLQFESELQEMVLENWAEAGVASRTLLDRVLVCPGCAALPTFGVSGRRFGSVGSSDEACGLRPVADCETGLTGLCLRCGLRFAAEQAHELELISYDVCRLDPLVVVGELSGEPSVRVEQCAASE